VIGGDSVKVERRAMRLLTTCSHKRAYGHPLHECWSVCPIDVVGFPSEIQDMIWSSASARSRRSRKRPRAATNCKLMNRYRHTWAASPNLLNCALLRHGR